MVHRVVVAGTVVFEPWIRGPIRDYDLETVNIIIKHVPLNEPGLPENNFLTVMYRAVSSPSKLYQQIPL